MHINIVWFLGRIKYKLDTVYIYSYGVIAMTAALPQDIDTTTVDCDKYLGGVHPVGRERSGLWNAGRYEFAGIGAS
jgi:hypothetical protein